jgi:hypothetical protein
VFGANAWFTIVAEGSSQGSKLHKPMMAEWHLLFLLQE